VNSNSVLEIININKSFPGVKALQNMNFNVYQNEIVGLVGENGAGKSTLMKILVGIYKMDKGEMKLYGKNVKLSDSRMAIQLGVGMVFQEGSLIPNLTIAENLFLGHENRFKQYGLISMSKVMKEAEKQLDRVGLNINPKTPVYNLSQASRQMVEVARLLWLSNIYHIENPLLILDEPTAVLTSQEIEKLFNIIRKIKNKASIIFISHRLEEIFELSDRIVVLKNGKNMANMKASETNIHQVEKLMIGRKLSKEYYNESEQNEPKDEVLLKVDGLEKKGSFRPISFLIKKGEILSLVGVVGSGKEDICKCIFGMMKPDNGIISIEGKEVEINNPKDAVKAGIGYIPINRREEGLALQMDVMSNITLVMLKKIIRNGLISSRVEKEEALRWIKKCSILTPSSKTLCKNLSGGNQQKVVLSKWLAANVKIMILNHPTRGVDVGAKEEFYKMIRLLALGGMSILLMSDRLEEDIGLCNRMIIMKDGNITEELACPVNDKPTPVDIISYIV
jgi:ribose transport system ATP-binding protein